MKTIIFYFFALFFFSWSTFAAPIIPENYDLVKREHSHIQKHDQHHAVLDSHHQHPNAATSTPIESQVNTPPSTQPSKRSMIPSMNHFERRNFWQKLKDFGKKALSWII
ncbi:SubName: Full=Uncharacterized protein {ECO:0000313/EMBL:CCA70267.1} [Serendipita indica DSM 11827]|nr:SubName: Full=Uncharacterized protein {ECO:0000313/EMBL:CCA70267.1} [Serendipita indica DSM 11827]